MKIIKRNGEEVQFDVQKIENAIRKANETVPVAERLSEDTIHKIGSRPGVFCDNAIGVMGTETVDMIDSILQRCNDFDRNNIIKIL